MTHPLLILDRQHAGKGTGNMGAAYDIDGDGRVETWEREANLTPHYIASCQRSLAAMGLPSWGIDPAGAGLVASYPQRHHNARHVARNWTGGPVGYVAAHLNAGGGRHGLVMHDARSHGGRLLAQAIAARLATLPVLAGCKVRALHAGDRGLSCVSGIYAGPRYLSGVVFEPLFLDCPDHAAYIADGGLEQVGHLLALGFVDWSMSLALGAA